MENHSIVTILNEPKYDNNSFLPMYYKYNEEQIPKKSISICNIQ